MGSTVVCHIERVALVVIVVYVLAHDIGIGIGYEHVRAVLVGHLVIDPECYRLVIGKHVSQGADYYQHRGNNVFRFHSILPPI